MSDAGSEALDRVLLAAGSGSAPPWMRKGSGTPTATNSSSASASSGLKLKADPTLPPGTSAVVDDKGKRVGTVKKIGNKFAASWDGFKATYASAQAAVAAKKS